MLAWWQYYLQGEAGETLFPTLRQISGAYVAAYEAEIFWWGEAEPKLVIERSEIIFLSLPAGQAQTLFLKKEKPRLLGVLTTRYPEVKNAIHLEF